MMLLGRSLEEVPGGLKLARDQRVGKFGRHVQPRGFGWKGYVGVRD